MELERLTQGRDLGAMHELARLQRESVHGDGEPEPEPIRVRTDKIHTYQIDITQHSDLVELGNYVSDVYPWSSLGQI